MTKLSLYEGKVQVVRSIGNFPVNDERKKSQLMASKLEEEEMGELANWMNAESKGMNEMMSPEIEAPVVSFQNYDTGSATSKKNTSRRLFSARCK